MAVMMTTLEVFIVLFGGGLGIDSEALALACS